MRFDQFVSLFPRMLVPLSERPDDVPAVGRQADFIAAPVPVAGYVRPNFTTIECPEEATVVLVEAAGAVGKSAAAAAIANELNWPLILAEHANVGSYSLSGLIQDKVGMRSTFLQRIAKGEAGVVVDSLDEAHLKAGTQNFLAFLGNIRWIAQDNDTGTPAGHRVLLFSRADTAEVVRMAFEEAHAPIAHFKIDFFTYDQAIPYINSYLDARYSATERPEYNVARAWQSAFNRLREARLKQIANVLSAGGEAHLVKNWSDYKAFLGYAPVLSTVAESLAVTNPTKHISSIKGDNYIGILVDIVESITNREQLKMRDKIAAKLKAQLPATPGAGAISANSLYTPEEQIARLADYCQGGNGQVPLPAGLPPAVRGNYEEAVEIFLPEHPFLAGRNFANTVFADYVYAQACLSDTVNIALRHPIANLERKVGPFFVRFLNFNKLQQTNMLDESHIEAVISSWNQECDLLGVAGRFCFVDFRGQMAVLHCERVMRKGGHEQIDFHIKGVSGAFQLNSPVQDTVVLTPHAVIVGRTRESLSFSGRVIIEAEEISIEAESIEVEPVQRASLAVLAAPIINSNYLRSLETHGGDFRVYSNSPPPQLRPYSVDLSAPLVRISFGMFYSLRRILTAFAPSAQGGPRVSRDKMDQVTLGDDAERNAIFQALTSVGAIVSDLGSYSLDLNAVSKLGFGLQDLHRPDPTTAVLQFLSRCVTENDPRLPH